MHLSGIQSWLIPYCFFLMTDILSDVLKCVRLSISFHSSVIAGSTDSHPSIAAAAPPLKRWNLFFSSNSFSSRIDVCVMLPFSVCVLTLIFIRCCHEVRSPIRNVCTLSRMTFISSHTRSLSSYPIRLKTCILSCYKNSGLCGLCSNSTPVIINFQLSAFCLMIAKWDLLAVNDSVIVH